jgi:glycosyltransferase involved in cell wall biosynthesis
MSDSGRAAYLALSASPGIIIHFMDEETGTKAAAARAKGLTGGAMSGTGEPRRASSGPDEATCVEVSDPAVTSVQPLVSVKMITYNHEPHIAKAVEGVLMQETDFPFELVIGEDCSTDRTREIVLEYQRKRPDVIRVIAWNRNAGGKRNGRKVIECLRGKYIAPCDGDDYWTHPKKLQMQVDIMEADPKVGLVHGGADTYDVARHKLHPWRPKPADYDEGDVFKKYLNGEYFVFNPTACIRMDLYRSVKRNNPDVFDGRYLMGDTQLWLELSRVTRFRLINEALATYTVLPESATRSRDVRKEIRFWKSALDMHLHLAHKYRVDGATEAYVRTTFARRFLRYAYVAGDRGLADEAWLELKSHKVRLLASDRAHYAGTMHGSVRAAMLAMRRLRDVLRQPQA